MKIKDKGNELFQPVSMERYMKERMVLLKKFIDLHTDGCIPRPEYDDLTNYMKSEGEEDDE